MWEVHVYACQCLYEECSCECVFSACEYQLMSNNCVHYERPQGMDDLEPVNYNQRATANISTHSGGHSEPWLAG